jgi:hypothetical protein
MNTLSPLQASTLLSDIAGGFGQEVSIPPTAVGGSLKPSLHEMNQQVRIEEFHLTAVGGSLKSWLRTQ